MAEARKCDRCMKCFDPKIEKREMARFENPYFVTAEKIADHKVCRTMFPDREINAYVDLCADCTTAFEFFMSGFDPVGQTV